jgi:N-ethylmaleimide reductase
VTRSNETTEATISNPIDTGALFEPIDVARVRLKNRIMMSPMTRSRTPDGVPNDINIEYYTQRASAGLIFGESTAISPTGIGFPNNPNIFNDDHVAGWRRVTDAVHALGGHMFLQLWHCGRNSQPHLQPGNGLPFGPSATPPSTEIKPRPGRLPPVTPRALEVGEIPALIGDYRNASKRAMAAGFDAVEIHAGNGYLLDQFLRNSTNHRTDAYGGTPENRRRLLLQVAEEVAEIWGADRVGVRLSPTNRAGYGMFDSDPQALFNCVVDGLQALGLGFIDVVEGETTDHPERTPFDYAVLRSRFKGVYMANNGYTLESGNAAIRDGHADMVAFGRPYIANPDLVERFRHGSTLNEMRRDTYNETGPIGYTDYPPLGG